MRVGVSKKKQNVRKRYEVVYISEFESLVFNHFCVDVVFVTSLHGVCGVFGNSFGYVAFGFSSYFECFESINLVTTSKCCLVRHCLAATEVAFTGPRSSLCVLLPMKVMNHEHVPDFIFISCILNSLMCFLWFN